MKKGKKHVIDLLGKAIMKEGDTYSPEEKKELLEALIEIVRSENTKKFNWQKVFKSLSKVYLTKEIIDYISQYLL